MKSIYFSVQSTLFRTAIAQGAGVEESWLVAGLVDSADGSVSLFDPDEALAYPRTHKPFLWVRQDGQDELLNITDSYERARILAFLHTHFLARGAKPRHICDQTQMAPAMGRRVRDGQISQSRDLWKRTTLAQWEAHLQRVNGHLRAPQSAALPRLHQTVQ